MFPQNVFPDTAEIDGQGRLVIGGCSALDLAEEYGTPVYVLDEATLRNRCRSYRAEFEQRCPGPRYSTLPRPTSTRPWPRYSTRRAWVWTWCPVVN